MAEKVKNFDEAQISKFEQVVLVLLVLLGLSFITAEHGGSFVHKTRTAAAEWLCPENTICVGKQNESRN